MFTVTFAGLMFLCNVITGATKAFITPFPGKIFKLTCGGDLLSLVCNGVGVG